jgi:hypothetical protein
MASKLYNISAECTISIHAIVEAKSKREAREKAKDLGMMGLCNQCSDGCVDDEPSDEWRTSGELDGEPRNIKAVEY